MGYIRKTIKMIDALPISDADRHKIHKGNARRLLKFWMKHRTARFYSVPLRGSLL